MVQTDVKFVSVKYSLFQMQHECFKQIKNFKLFLEDNINFLIVSSTKDV